MRLSFVVTFALCSLGSAQTLVLPDNHNFMESATLGANEGDGNHWSSTGGRFQIVYEASHFTGAAGIAGPITVKRLQFRGEDGEANLGGQVFANVVVQLGSTSLTAASLSTSFAGNRAAGTTTLGAPGTVALLTVAPSLGSCPNSWCIEIDLSAIGAAHSHDPLSAQPNLLIDVTCPTPPTQISPQFLLPMQDTTARGAGIRGASVWAPGPAATSGTKDFTPPVVGLEFGGSGGWSTEIPARAERIGAGCGGAHATIYQAFTQDQRFDLAPGLVFTPDVYPNPTTYTVTRGSAPLDPSRLGAAADSTADDGLVTRALGFAQQPFTYPGGGSTNDVRACTNGFVWLDSAMTSAGWQPTTSTLLGASANETARFAPFWSDLTGASNLGIDPRAGLHVTTEPETSPGAGDAVCWITWWHMGAYRVANGTAPVHGHAVFDFQLVIREQDGVVEFRYGAMPPFVSTLWVDTMENAALVGFALGRLSPSPLVASLDPGSRDLSHELPFTTSVEGATQNVALSATGVPFAGSPLQTARLIAGQSMTWNVTNVPPGTTIALLNLDLGSTQPGLQLPPAFGLLAPDCMISTSVEPALFGWELWILPGSTVTGTVPLVVPSGWEGAVVTAQAIGFDLTPGAPFLIPWASNAIRYTIGLD